MRWRTLVVGLWVIILAMLIPYAVSKSHAQAPLATTTTQSKIHITQTLKRIYRGTDTTGRLYLLWNRRVRDRPLGHASYGCRIVVRRIDACSAVFVLPLGKIATTGEIHSFWRFSMVITGGTRSERAKKDDHPGYLGAIGTLDAWREGPGTYSLTFTYTLG